MRNCGNKESEHEGAQTEKSSDRGRDNYLDEDNNNKIIGFLEIIYPSNLWWNFDIFTPIFIWITYDDLIY